MTWLTEMFGTAKPIIAMCHLQALPGDPHYDYKGGMDSVIEKARADLIALQEGGVDGVMFSNEFSMPYLTKTHPVTLGCMARIIGELKADIAIPFGVNILWDPTASIDLAVATGALFVREIFTGVYASDFGLWNTNVGEIARHRAALQANDVKLFYNIVPEAAVYLGGRGVEDIAKTTVFNNLPDALCVSGLTAGSETDPKKLKIVKEIVPDTIVFANTGINKNNVSDQLEFADGAIVGTTFKVEGKFENSVDQSRVSDFMEAVGRVRS